MGDRRNGPGSVVGLEGIRTNMSKFAYAHTFITLLLFSSSHPVIYPAAPFGHRHSSVDFANRINLRQFGISYLVGK